MKGPVTERSRVATGALLFGFLATAALIAVPAAALSGCASSNPCPAAYEDEYTTTVGEALSVSAPGLLANDQGIAGTQVDIDGSDSESWNGAQIDIRPDGSFTYRSAPQDPFTGVDYFDYTIVDPEDGWDVNTVTVYVNALVRNDGYQTRPGTKLTIDPPGIFANDIGYDDSTLFADTLTNEGGEVLVAEDGGFVYVPPSGFRGTDAFSYTVNDTNGDNYYAAVVSVYVDDAAVPGPSPRGRDDDGPGNPPNTDPEGFSDPGNNTGSGTTPNTDAEGNPIDASSSTTTGSSTTGENGGGNEDPSGSSGGSDSDGRAAGAGGDGDGDGDGGSSAALPIAIALAVVALAGTGGFLWWRRRSLAADVPISATSTDGPQVEGGDSP
jgi:hypothetical protein